MGPAEISIKEGIEEEPVANLLKRDSPLILLLLRAIYDSCHSWQAQLDPCARGS